MLGTIYALLVGIDHYPSPVNSLHGCVNDIKRMETWLRARTQLGDGQKDSLLVLTNEQATRQGLIDGFRNHLCQSCRDDAVLFYYSGHGSQAPSPPEFWHLEPDRLDETLVCYDSRLPGSWDLADKELAQLIAEVAETGAHVTVILDCCHSGSGTRVPSDPSVRVRRAPTDNRLRPIHTFLVNPAQATVFSPITRSVQGGGWYTLPRGRHVVLAACSPEEEAKELCLGGEQRGIFSYCLVDTLERASTSLTYRDLFKRVNALVRFRVASQSPQMEATVTSDLTQRFLSDAMAASPPYFMLSHDKQRGWVIDGGAVHGIPAPTDSETTLLALFPFDVKIDQLSILATAIGEARVRHVFPTQSAVTATLMSGAVLDPDTIYKAVVTALPLPPLVVALAGDEAALALARRELITAGTNGERSLLVCEGSCEEAELYVLAEDNCYRIRRKGDAYPLVVDTPGCDAGGAQLVVQRLEHIARWRKIMELANPTSHLPSDAIHMEILCLDENGQWQPMSAGANVRLEYMYKDSAWQPPQFKIKLSNTTRNQRLYCMLFDLPETYGVFPSLSGGGVWLEPGQEVWANDGEPIYATVLDALWYQGISEFHDTLKVIVSTDACDATLLAQDDLPVTVQRGLDQDTRALLRLNTLNRLMLRVYTRHFSSKPAHAEACADWITAEVSFTTIRPLAATNIAPPGQQMSLGHGVTVMGHAHLRARARLTSLHQVGRDAGNLTLPALFRDHPDVVQPFEFSTSRNGASGLSVLELVDIADHTVVTADNPLTINIAAPLAANEHMLPVGFDGEFFLPLGRVARIGEGIKVTCERLPAPTSRGVRALTGSIRILFQKMVSERLDLDFPYPLLTVAAVDEQGRVTYTRDQDSVKAQVAAANCIVLYIHGIIGDTRGMAASAFPQRLGLPATLTGLAARYQVLLTFDYENIHTTIAANAQLLKQRLQAIGLGPHHGKTLHIVAHSMGGLVARWLIEREGGNHLIQHLVMMGTPNAGSPWPSVQDWATVALALGLNALSSVAWPVQVLGSLVSALEIVDNALDEMKSGSDLLQSLASSPDPGIPYTIIAGNTSIISAVLLSEEDSAVLLSEEDKVRGTFARLWEKIQPKHWMHALTAPVFFGQPNDIAVSVVSVQSVPSNRTPRPVMVDPVACDHLTYFSSVGGLQALAAALGV